MCFKDAVGVECCWLAILIPYADRFMGSVCTLNDPSIQQEPPAILAKLDGVYDLISRIGGARQNDASWVDDAGLACG